MSQNTPDHAPDPAPVISAPADLMVQTLRYLKDERGRLASVTWRVYQETILDQQLTKFDATLHRDDGQSLHVGGTWDLEETRILANRYPDASAMIDVLNKHCDEIEDDFGEQEILFTVWSESEQGIEWLHRLFMYLQRADLKGATTLDLTMPEAP